MQGGSTNASTLTFQFIPQTNVVELRYVFASEEYDDVAATPLDDVFGLFVNGQDYARVPGTGTPLAGTGETVSIDTINAQVNSQYYIDNSLSPFGGFGELNTQMNGLTRVLTMEAPVVAGQVNTLSITIADTNGSQLDSAVFLKSGSFRSIDEKVAPAVGERVLATMVKTLKQLEPATAAGALTPEQIQLAFQESAVNAVIKSSGLTGNFLVIPIDPIDFTLTGPNGLSVSSSSSSGVSGNVANAFFAQTGSSQLLIVPNANPGLYQVSLSVPAPANRFSGPATSPRPRAKSRAFF